MIDIELQTKRLYLRTPHKKMLRAIISFNNKNKERFKVWEGELDEDYYTKAYQKRLIKAERKAQHRSDSLCFYIFKEDTLSLVGKISVYSVAFGNASNAVLGYKLDKDAEGRGYMKEALEKVVEFMFDEINLHRLEINLIERNVRSKNLAKSLGFTLEGESKQFMEINGQWEDHLRYVLINKRWKKA